MRELRLAGLDVRLAGGPDRQGGGDGPLVVLLHGFGAPGDDLVPLWRVLDVPREVRFAFPAAPLQLAMGLGDSRAWWMIDFERLERLQRRETSMAERTREVPAGMAEARTLVDEMLGELLAALGPPDGQVILGGFSQGAMLALDLALRSPRRLGGLVLLSGTLLAEHEWRPLMARRRGLRVLQSHGQEDPLLPFGHAERLRDLLIDAGVDVTWVPFHGHHEIPGSVLDELSLFLDELARG